jgi:hypothetical protein
MTEQEVFVLADRTLNDVVAKISDDQWDMRMPASFARRGAGEPPTLREIVNYHAYDDSWVAGMLAGKTMEEAGRDNFKGDLLGATPSGRSRRWWIGRAKLRRTARTWRGRSTPRSGISLPATT